MDFTIRAKTDVMDFDASQADLTTALLFGRPRRAGTRWQPPAGGRAVDPCARSVFLRGLFYRKKKNP